VSLGLISSACNDGRHEECPEVTWVAMVGTSLNTGEVVNRQMRIMKCVCPCHQEQGAKHKNPIEIVAEE
jgi:hypothetical protein